MSTNDPRMEYAVNAFLSGDRRSCCAIANEGDLSPQERRFVWELADAYQVPQTLLMAAVIVACTRMAEGVLHDA